MSKLKQKNKNNQIIILSKLEKKEQINQQELETLSAKNMKGVMRPTVLKPRKIEYLAPSGITLEQYLANEISLNEFYVLFAQIIEIVKVLSRNGFNLSNLMLDFKFVYVNLRTKEVHMLYQPLITQQCVCMLPSFLCDMISKTKPALGENLSSVVNLSNYIIGLKGAFTPEKMEEYIVQNYPQVYKQIPRQKPGQSQQFKGDDLYYRQDRMKQTVSANTRDYGTMNSGANGFDQESDTALLVEDEEATSLLTRSDTSSIDEADGTALLYQEQFKYPFLIRKSNFDRKDIDKPVFRVGKERSYVDYFVQNNSAVSRLHADIISNDGHFFIKDNNSTNGTFVNGVEIYPEREVEIFDGDEIILANEEFEFHID
ncbi:MAG: FHA domain-containing protein [Ruminococcaceae bacterium]|nr:FHA domain-containing protein [Oscillospiraceae bacterium]